jgi:hypothetical protein
MRSSSNLSNFGSENRLKENTATTKQYQDIWGDLAIVCLVSTIPDNSLYEGMTRNGVGLVGAVFGSYSSSETSM